MRIRSSILFVAFSFLLSFAQAQGDRCQSAELQAAMMEDTAFARSFFAFEAAIAEMSNSAQRSGDHHVLPVVVHIMHNGEGAGNGSNISEAQVQSAIDALNADFSGTFGGADVNMEFQLAARDPEGNPTSGITRTNVTDVIPSFATTGMVTNNNSDPASEMNIKTLSHWPGTDYINIWVLYRLNGGTSPLGFAYLPPTSGEHDGIVVHHKVFGVGEAFDLLPNFDLNRTLTHEVGHYLGLYHTFNGTNDCGDETNCAAQGDRVCDTPPTTGSIGCSPIDCPETLSENFMDYSNDPCMESFTEGQKVRMRDALEVQRASLLESEGTIPVMATDAGISSIEGLASQGCNPTLEPQVTLQNFGTAPLTYASIHFALDGGTVNTMVWSGNLAEGETAEVALPTMAASSGSHALNVWITTVEDGYALNDTLAVDFEVLDGAFLQMDIQLDALPFGFTWSLQNVDNGLEIMSGADYTNGTFSNVYISESQCATTGCYELVVEDLFGNGLHYPPGGWYTLTDDGGNVLGTGSGDFGSEQTHAFCIEGTAVEPCVDANGNDLCDASEPPVVTGCTDPLSCTFNAEANSDDGSCDYLDAVGGCGGNCPGDADGDSICDDAEIEGCMDPTACNYDSAATDDGQNCTYPPVNFDCEGNVVVAIMGCTDEGSCTYDAVANTDDGSCEYLDALGECGGDCAADLDGDGICDSDDISGCMDPVACNYNAEATASGECEYAEAGFDCDGNPLTNSVSDLTERTLSLTTYPNPINQGGFFRISGLPAQGGWDLEIRNATGQLVRKAKLQAGESQGAWSVGVEAPQKAGVYIVKLTSSADTGISTGSSRILVH